MGEKEDSRFVAALLTALAPLKGEIAATRQEIGRAYTSTSAQTERLITATERSAGAQRLYTVLTVMLVLATLFQAGFIYTQKVSAERAAVVAREAQCATIRIGLDVLDIERQIMAGQVAWGIEAGDSAQLRRRIADVEHFL